MTNEKQPTIAIKLETYRLLKEIKYKTDISFKEIIRRAIKIVSSNVKIIQEDIKK